VLLLKEERDVASACVRARRSGREQWRLGMHAKMTTGRRSTRAWSGAAGGW
jgi:hypothetical protein